MQGEPRCCGGCRLLLMKMIIIINTGDPVIHSQPNPSPLPLRPPRPHDPSHRACVSEFHGWSFWVTPRNHPDYDDLQRRAALFLQLYHYRSSTSVLTPSPLTNGHYELWTPTLHQGLCCYRHTAQQLREIGGPELPCPGFVHRITAMFIHSALVGVRPETP